MRSHIVLVRSLRYWRVSRAQISFNLRWINLVNSQVTCTSNCKAQSIRITVLVKKAVWWCMYETHKKKSEIHSFIKKYNTLKLEKLVSIVVNRRTFTSVFLILSSMSHMNLFQSSMAGSSTAEGKLQHTQASGHMTTHFHRGVENNAQSLPTCATPRSCVSPSSSLQTVVLSDAAGHDPFCSEGLTAARHSNKSVTNHHHQQTHGWYNHLSRQGSSLVPHTHVSVSLAFIF